MGLFSTHAIPVRYEHRTHHHRMARANMQAGYPRALKVNEAQKEHYEVERDKAITAAQETNNPTLSKLYLKRAEAFEHKMQQRPQRQTFSRPPSFSHQLARRARATPPTLGEYLSGQR